MNYKSIVSVPLNKEAFNDFYNRAVIFKEQSRKIGDRTFFTEAEKAEKNAPEVYYVPHLSPESILLDCVQDGERMLVVMAVCEPKTYNEDDQDTVYR